MEIYCNNVFVNSNDDRYHKNYKLKVELGDVDIDYDLIEQIDIDDFINTYSDDKIIKQIGIDTIYSKFEREILEEIPVTKIIELAIDNDIINSKSVYNRIDISEFIKYIGIEEILNNMDSNDLGKILSI